MMGRRLSLLMARAQGSRFYLAVLNLLLRFMVPFNRPHGLKVMLINGRTVTVAASPRRSNRNHLGSMHACLLATLCEYASGLSLMSGVDPAQYRLIMKDMHMSYHRQARTRVAVTASLEEEILQQQLQKPLSDSGTAMLLMQVDAFDEEGRHICTAQVHWQVKAWNHVATPVK